MNAEDHFFATGRGASILRGRLDEFITTGQSTLLTSIQGEWSVFYFRKDIRKLICGRDIFARKSLCWRLSKAASGSVLEISTFPGQTSDDWNEIFPGTFFIFPLLENECDFIHVSENKFITDHRELKCSALRADFQTEVQLQIISFFPRELLADDLFVNAFRNIDFTHLNSDHLLKPTATVQAETSETAIDNVGVEFYRRFCAGINDIGVNSEKLSAGDKVMVLFSGGVDSLLVAFVAGRLAPVGVEILLVNVAFGESNEECGEAPDRQRSINAFKFLRDESRSNLANARFRLVLVNVGRAELAKCRHDFIAPAIFPARSVLDDSIGCVLWFAARARGVEYTDGDDDDGTPPKFVDFSRPDDVKFVLVGSGADEQLGGYARHRTLFEKFGFERLAEELAMELSRIGRRNFGRDDRIATTNHRTLLAPFLEEPFVEWLNQVPLSIKVDFSLPRGEGEKRLLRRVLVNQGVPLPLASQPKRAMQFGSRIAKLENRREKGSDVCERLVVANSITHIDQKALEINEEVAILE